MVQNHVETIPWTQYLGSSLWTKYYGPNTMDQNHDFQHVRAFTLINPRVYAYAPSSSLYRVYTLFLHGQPAYSSLFTCFTMICPLSELPSPVSFLWVSCQQGQRLNHNANNLPLWTWWQPPHQVTLPLWHQGQRADQDILFLGIPSAVRTPPEYLLKSLNELPLCICQGVSIRSMLPLSKWKV